VQWIKSECDTQESSGPFARASYDCTCIVHWVEKHETVSKVEHAEQLARASRDYPNYISAGQVPACQSGNSVNSGNSVSVNP
jgi:hypothetical protein